jgi:hypothetical protein
LCNNNYCLIQDQDVEMSSEQEHLRFQALCVWMARVSGAMAVGFLAFAVGMWMHPSGAVWIAREQWVGGNAAFTLTPLAQFAAGALSCAHLGLLCWALWTARGLFLRFAAGATLETQGGRDLRAIGGFIALYAVLTPAVKTLMTVALTLGNPPGQRLLAVGIGTNELILGMLGALILVLGHVMAEAARIADDNRQIV